MSKARTWRLLARYAGAVLLTVGFLFPVYWLFMISFKTPEEIFVTYERVKELVGNDEMKNIPLGAVGIYSFCDKLRVGMQQLMAGSRCFRVHAITRKELMSLTRECADVTGVPYVMDCYRDEAMEVLDSSTSFSIF